MTPVDTPFLYQQVFLFRGCLRNCWHNNYLRRKEGSKMMDVFAIRKEGKVTIIELLTELDRLSVLAIKNQLAELVKKRRKKFIINFDKIDFINSTIVGALVGMRTLVRGRSGDLVLCNVEPKIRRTFDLIGASQILKIYDTEKDALENI
ncbi:TPA: anti-sigma factor antagonist [Candidatus Poribacteria bacterium]|nr:anti-sigma factor antagonist [Candidatus Poribacteria bacterium]